MKFFRRHRAEVRTNDCAHERTIDFLRDQQTSQRKQAEADRADLIARLSTRYYAADALVQASFAGKDEGNRHQIGVASGIIQALAEVTGLDEMVVDHRLHHGIPVTATGWLCTNEAPVGAPGDLWLLHDGIRESRDERVSMLRRNALRDTGHPMYQVLHGTVGV